MKLKLLLLIICAAALAGAAQNKEFIGYKHKGVVVGETLANGATDRGGSLLSVQDYGVSHFSKGKTEMLWLEKITARDEKGVPSWIVKDVIVLKPLKKNQEILFSYGAECRQDKKEVLDLVMVAEFLPAKKIYKISQAWKADANEAKFSNVKVKGITCRYVEPEN